MNLAELSYQTSQTKQVDFDSFWCKRIAESHLQPLALITKPRPYTVPDVEVYDVYFDGFRNSRIHGVYVKPKEVKGPAAVMFHGYNWNTLQPHHTFKYVLQGIPVLQLDVRGQNILSPDQNVYENGGSAGWMLLGIMNPDQYYYSYVYMDSYRSIEVVKELSGQAEIVVEGSSQGGALAIASAALHKDIKLVCADIPFLTNIEQTVNLAADGPYQELQHYFKVHDPLYRTKASVFATLSYIDCMNLASDVSCPTLLGIGMKDAACPPLGAFGLYHHLHGEKQMRVYPEYGHELPPVHEEEKLRFLSEFF
ncbi:acetylxylan esterase [Ectobacillus sp. JY-23]|uniref:acetylxylan esterase n=1 Tax=Ectobacillus sp. JY-23 TaxID=2933872 RepID=UPI001FF32407|nr:acetylxylan esterase [Ectobacillus sp. JY-23]UOY93091.1 acetylxylan esterase [Ectobacillus sp. JY-23]